LYLIISVAYNLYHGKLIDFMQTMKEMHTESIVWIF
jgi:hypothetical protein